MIACNAPATITPPDAPLALTATATDAVTAAPAVSILNVACERESKSGKFVPLTCQAAIGGATLHIFDSGGVGNHLTWRVRAVDACGNTVEQTCDTQVVNPGKGKGK